MMIQILLSVCMLSQAQDIVRITQEHKDRAKDIYLDLMEEAVMAYTPERIEDYIARVDRDGIHEHGFPRLASNIGILVAKGRIPQYKDLFVRLMDLAVREVPVARDRNQHRGTIGNEFSVKEMVGCILECEKSGLFTKEQTDSWRRGLEDMKADDIYMYRPEPGDPVARNWCVFGAASECARVHAGIGGDMGTPRGTLPDAFCNQLVIFCSDSQI